MAILTPTPKQQLYGTDGAPLVGGKIYTYAAGTTTPLATYTDAGGGTANTNPIILNSLGQANIWLTPSSSYKFSVYTSVDVLLYTVDNITAPVDYLSLVTLLASPPPIGSTAPNTGAFTSLSSTGALTVGGAATVTGALTASGVANVTGALTVGGAATVTGAASVTGVVSTAASYQFADNSIQPSAAAPQINTFAATVAANALTISKTQSSLAFRSTTLGSGTVTYVTGTPANLVVPSTATLGTVSAVQSRIVVLALNNAGTIELAVVNISGGTDLSETGLISTTAISAGSTSASVVYSTTARTSVAYRVIGYIESTQATAGTWATAPSTIQGVGGQALTAMSSIGYGQTYQSVARTTGTTYYNTTGKPIFATIGTGNASSTFSITVNGATVFTIPANQALTGFAIIPPGASYVYNCTPGTFNTFELR